MIFKYEFNPEVEEDIINYLLNKEDIRRQLQLNEGYVGDVAHITPESEKGQTNDDKRIS